MENRESYWRLALPVAWQIKIYCHCHSCTLQTTNYSPKSYRPPLPSSCTSATSAESHVFCCRNDLIVSRLLLDGSGSGYCLFSFCVSSAVTPSWRGGMSLRQKAAWHAPHQKADPFYSLQLKLLRMDRYALEAHHSVDGVKWKRTHRNNRKAFNRLARLIMASADRKSQIVYQAQILQMDKSSYGRLSTSTTTTTTNNGRKYMQM